MWLPTIANMFVFKFLELVGPHVGKLCSYTKSFAAAGRCPAGVCMLYHYTSELNARSMMQTFTIRPQDVHAHFRHSISAVYFTMYGPSEFGCKLKILQHNYPTPHLGDLAADRLLKIPSWEMTKVNEKE